MSAEIRESASLLRVVKDGAIQYGAAQYIQGRNWHSFGINPPCTFEDVDSARAVLQSLIDGVEE